MKSIALFLTVCATLGAADKPAPPSVPALAAFHESSPTSESSARASGAAAPAAEAKWWTVFQDPLLDSLVERALRNNHDVRIAAARVAEARAAGGVTKSALLPDIGLSASASRIRGGYSQGVVRVAGASRGSGSLVTPFETGIFQGGLQTRWEIDLFGGRRKDLDAAHADAAAAEENRQDVLLVVAAEVATNYLEYRGAQQELAIVEQNREAQEETLRLTRVRAEAGLATDLDVERQVAQLAATEAALAPLQIEKALRLHRLGVLAGEEPGAFLAELEQPRALPATPPDIDTGLPSELLKRRPDIRRAQAEIAAAFAREGAARKDLFPKFVITGFSGRQSTSVSGLTLGAGNFFGFGPGIELPIFTGGRIRSNIAVQNARLEQATRHYEQEVLAAFEETENALASFHREQDRRASLAAAVEASRTSVDLSRELFLAGLGDFLSVLDAQRAQFAAEQDLQRSETAVRTSLIALYKTLGGGVGQ